MRKVLFFLLFSFCFLFSYSQNDFALRINAGGTEVDYNNQTFIADANFDTGRTLDRPQTGLPEPYQTFRYSRTQVMGYDIPMADGEYTVNLYFAELYFGATDGGSGGAGERVFDVSIEGQLAEDNLDVFAEVGAETMLIKSHTVTVTGGVLDVDFDSRDAVGGERHPIINAIEVLGNDTTFPLLTINPIAEQSNVINAPINLNVLASGGDPNVDFSFDIFGQPSGISINQTSGLISGIIDETAATGGANNDGVHEVTVIVSKSGSTNASGTFDWIITDPECVWNDLADANIDRFEGISQKIGDKLYVFGGLNPVFSVVPETEIYDTTNDVWTIGASMPIAVTHTAAIAVGHEIWIVGGFAGHNPGVATGVVQIYDTQTDTWAVGPSLPNPVGSLAGTLYDNKIYVVGGLLPDRMTDVEDHLVLDLDNISAGWNSIAPMPSPRNHHSYINVNGILYAIGGQFGHDGSHTDTNLVHAYDSNGDVWTRVADLARPRSHFKAGTTVHNGKIIIVGGTEGPVEIDEVSQYDPQLNLWTELCKLPAGLEEAAAQAFGDKLIVSGGRTVGNSNSIIKKTIWLKLDPSVSQPPVVDAGADQSITLPADFVTIEGSGSDPDGGAISYLWSLQNGPTGAVLTGADTPNLSVTNLVAGDYTYRLTVTDDENETAFDEITITVNSELRPFITTWKTDNPGASEDNQITIPTFSVETYDYIVDWGDGTSDSGVTGNITHTYETTGTYQVSISGEFPRINFNNQGDKDKFVMILQWGDVDWYSMQDAFYGCSSLDIVATDIPDFSKVQSTKRMFTGCNSLMGTDYFNNWDMSRIIDMTEMFFEAAIFNQNISNWNVGNVTKMEGMFGKSSFNQDIGNWNVSDVRNMRSMFWQAASFNQDISGWNTSSAENMSGMFVGASDFNQDIGLWNTSAVTNMGSMFYDASSFNQDISGWNTSSVETMSGMFTLATEFNQDIGLWNTSSVQYMDSMFASAISFNQDIGSWDIGQVLNMVGMFPNSGLSDENYDKILSAWGELSVVQDDVELDAPQNQYCQGEEARQKLIDDFGWTITDGGKAVDCIEPSELSIIGFTYQEGDSVSQPLTDETRIELGFPGEFPLDGVYQIEPSYEGNVESIQYELIGPQGSISQSSSTAPFSFNGDNRLNEGFYLLTATPYTTHNGEVVSGEPLTVSFEVYSLICQDFINTTFLEVTPASCTSNGSVVLSGPYSFSDSYLLFEYDENWVNRNILFEYDFLNLPLGNYEIFPEFGIECLDGLRFEIEYECIEPNDFALRINTGGTEVDYNGETFIVDTYFDQGRTLDRPQTGLPEPYQTFRYSRSQQMSYDIPLEDGEYTVNLYFAELWFGATGGGSGGVGSRVFDVSIEGQLAEDNLDVFAEVGTEAMLVKSHTVMVTGGVLDIDFDSRDAVGGERHPIINAIEILGTGTPEQRPFVTTWNTEKADSNPGNQITIPTFPELNYDYSVDWGDGSSNSNVTGNISHTYSSTGVYQVSITGLFPRIYFKGIVGPNKLVSVDQWGDNKWTSMEGAFYRAGLDVLADDVPDLTQVTSMKEMFLQAGLLNSIQGFENWNVSNVTDMSYAFDDLRVSLDLSNWNVSNVTNMRSMFGSSTFNGDISNWDVGNVTNMSEMFVFTTFDRDISNWNVRNVTDFSYMFLSSDFNQDISGWDVSNAITMEQMFGGAFHFNQDIGDWDVSNVVDMSYMFSYSPFNQDLGAWNISNVTSMADMFSGAALQTTNYDSTLQGWAALTSLINGIVFDAGDSKYCFGEDARQELIDNNEWIINDAGKECEERPFVTTWQVIEFGDSTVDHVTIPTFPGETYNYTVDWGDGRIDTNVTGDISHSYGSVGSFRISITGDFPRIYFNNQGDKDKLLLVEQWGDVEWSSMQNAFFGCSNLDVVATDDPDLTNALSTKRMFNGCISLVGNEIFNSWDVSRIIDMTEMFFEATIFNQNINNWNVGSATSMEGMFGISSFNQDIGNWNVSNVRNMRSMFWQAASFNQNVSGWNTSSAENMSGMFTGAVNFDQNIGLWNTTNVTRMDAMFYEASSFNQDISNWNTSSVETMSGMFTLAANFNQDIGLWNTSNVIFMESMFSSSGLSNENYDNTLIGWSQLPFLQNGVQLDAPQNQYCLAEDARQSIIDNYGWVINDSGKAADCPEPSDLVLRINSGGTEVDYNGETFSVDTYFNTGSTLDRPQTGLPEPYQTFRYSRSQQMSYDIPIPDGEYTVNLHFAELYFGATGGGSGGAGKRVFDVNIEGQLAEDNLDIFAEVGAETMLIKSHAVTVTGGVLDIDFDSRDAVGGERHPVINAIEILGANGGGSGKLAIGKKNIVNENMMNLYPNQVSDFATISFEKPTKVQQIFVFDMIGRLIQSYKPGEIGNGGTYTIDVNSYQQGPYIIKMIDNKGVNFQKQMLVKRQ